jgi:hypothetical protein
MSADLRKPFKSRFNDPDHPANSGSLISLVTGGAIAMPDRKQVLMDKGKRGFRTLTGQEEPADNTQGQNGKQRKPASGGLIKTVMKMKQDDIFYLTMINMPTHEDIDAAKAQLEDVSVDWPPNIQSTAATTAPYGPDDFYPPPPDVAELPAEPSISELPAEPVAPSQVPSAVAQEQEWQAAGPQYPSEWTGGPYPPMNPPSTSTGAHPPYPSEYAFPNHSSFQPNC